MTPPVQPPAQMHGGQGRQSYDQQQTYHVPHQQQAYQQGAYQQALQGQGQTNYVPQDYARAQYNMVSMLCTWTTKCCVRELVCCSGPVGVFKIMFCQYGFQYSVVTEQVDICCSDDAWSSRECITVRRLRSCCFRVMDAASSDECFASFAKQD